LQSGDDFGTVAFVGSDGTGLIRGAQISAAVDGTPVTNDMPGRLVFSTTADGASSPTERMRIRQDGTGWFNTTSAGSGNSAGTYRFSQIGGLNTIIAEQNTGSGWNFTSNAQSNAGTHAHINFLQNGTSVGTITSAGSTTSYSTSSDYRLKDNISPLTGAIDRINDLQVHRFNFISDPARTVDGFIAHEAQAVVPECVTGEKDAVDDDGNPIYQGIDQSKLVPLLTAALQEAIGRIETLEAEVTALKAS
jgi:hypothetical protein